MDSHCFKLHRSYLISFNLSNVGEIFWVKSDRTVSKFRKRKRKFLCRAHPLDKAGEWNWEVPWCSRVTTAKKCTKKCDTQAKLFFCQSKSVNQKFCYHSNVTSHFSTLYCSFGVDVTAAMLVIRNKSITLLWEVKPAFESVEEILRRDYSNESQSSTFRRHCLRCIRRFQI